jgi:urocanate hydratase
MYTASTPIDSDDGSEKKPEITDNRYPADAMTIRLDTIFDALPERSPFVSGIRRAPKRALSLTDADTALALKNALRYIPEKWHKTLAPEFMDELYETGRIYGYRFRPPGRIHGKPIEQYTGRCTEGKAFQVMIDNNLDFEVALYPYELTTYGETGQVCQNWMQYRLIKRYLEVLTTEQTLVVASGHPAGLFRSRPAAPRVMITNGLMVGAFDDAENHHRGMALGVTNYGQMTAGGWMYIGPQGIVHGTYSTILNAGRAILNIPPENNMAGRIFVSSGLGGMSGAQGKAVKIAGGVGLIAEVDDSRIDTRKSQGWVDAVVDTPGEAFQTARQAAGEKKPLALAFRGNVVDLLEYACDNNETIDLLSDQTSCHAAYDGGYCPRGLTFAERTELLKTDRPRFAEYVNRSLQHHYRCIQTLVNRGTYFFDYGNSFLKAVYDTGVTDICKNGKDPTAGFIFPSYVEDIMGPLLFDYGYGPFRWVCLSGETSDLRKTDQAALACIDPNRRFQDRDRKPAGRGYESANSLPRRRGPDADCAAVQRNGPNRRDRPRHARSGSPRYRRHRFPLPGNRQHPRRKQHHGGHGGPLLRRKRGPGDEPGRPAQRRRRRRRKGRQRRLRAGVGW